jgi:hypothetical protein
MTVISCKQRFSNALKCKLVTQSMHVCVGFLSVQKYDCYSIQTLIFKSFCYEWYSPWLTCLHLMFVVEVVMDKLGVDSCAFSLIFSRSWTPWWLKTWSGSILYCGSPRMCWFLFVKFGCIVGCCWNASIESLLILKYEVVSLRKSGSQSGQNARVHWFFVHDYYSMYSLVLDEKSTEYTKIEWFSLRLLLHENSGFQWFTTKKK